MSPTGEPTAAAATVAAFAHALSVLLKATAVYPRAHPRVQAAAGGFLALLPSIEDPGRWLPVRVRGNEIGVGERWLPIDAPLLEWMADKLRDAGLCGIEFGAGCTIDDVLEFAEILGRSRARGGVTFASLWQTDHPRLRPLDLVFHGDHKDEAVRPDTVLAPTEAEVRRGELLHRLEEQDAIVQRMLSIEAGCRQAGDSPLSEELDLLAAIVDLLPNDVVVDPEQVAEVVLEVLDRVHANLLEVLRKNERVDDAELTRLALSVARKFFEARGPTQPMRRHLPAGRPEDDVYGPDLNALLLEFASLPECSGLELPPAAEFERTARAVTTELLGIQLHLLVHTKRAESLARLRQNLAPLAKGLDYEQTKLLDAYLQPGRDGAQAPIGDAATLALLSFFERIGMAGSIRKAGYLTRGLLVRTFPVSLPLAARVLGGDPDGLSVLGDAIARLEPAQKAGGLQVAVQQGILLERAVVEALIRVGTEAVLPLLDPAAASDDPKLKAMLIDFARGLGLPEAEAAVLRCCEPASMLPGHYVQELLRVAAQHRQPDPRVRAFSGQLLRAAVDRGLEHAPLERMLGAIASLRYAPGPESATFLRRLATEGRFRRFGARARAIRRQAKETLATMPTTGRT